MRRLIRRLRSEQDGASAVIMAMSMTIVLIVAALVIDVGAMSARSAQLQDAADAAALAIAQQCYESGATNELAGCDPAVQSAATTIASQIASATVNDGQASVIGVPEFELHTVTVYLASAQASIFSWSAGHSNSSVGASATAEWNQPVVALPLAINACSLPQPSGDTVFIGTGLYNGVGQLLQSITSILGGASLPDYVSNILNCGTNVLAGGWLTSPSSDCSYDPNLITYLSSTVTKVLPLNSCEAVIQGLVGKRVIVPVYESSTINALGSVLGSATVTRYAEITVTGYDFDGLLGIGTLAAYPSGNSPGCASTVQEFLGVDLGGLGGLLDALLAPLFSTLLPTVLACQGLQGQLVHDNLTPEQASQLLTPYRLVA